MTAIPAAEWREHLDTMITGLRDTGALTDPRWIEAFRAVPRHVFTPHLRDSEGRDIDVAEARQAWLRRVYQDDSLITAVTHEPGLGTDVPTSSSTRPGLMARMLELLQLREGMRVLEIGTGTGYNAGLLTHRLGACHVTSIDIDPTLIEDARCRLHSLNLAPHLLVGDGLAGVPDHAPFDRIIATCAVPGIPLAWITQLAPGGAMLVNLRGEIACGTLCLLSKDATGDDEVIGPFLGIAGHFMWARHDPARALPYGIQSTSERDQTRTTTDPGTVATIAHDVANPDFRFLVQLHIRGIRTLAAPPGQPVPTTIHAAATDGSWATAHIATGKVAQGGTRRLWDNLCAAHTLWCALGQPPPTRFGVVATPTAQFAYLDHDRNWTRWPLPLL
ncbi:MAG: methyltransferase domain-containing protein [Pseudonocardiales bacterium]|nr:methyltransferase domain-containing protein [Pseudonocardiales bacterium]